MLSHTLFMLAQAAHSIPPQDRALIQFMLIGAVLGIGLLVVIGLAAAWRNYNHRQREIDMAQEEREGDLPRPDAWATAAQRIAAEGAGPDEAHVASDPGPPGDGGMGFNEGDDEEDDDDDFPFNLDGGDEDDDDDGPIGRA
jgi:hypothetical protein